MSKVKICVRDRYTKKDGTALLYCVVYLNRKRVRIPTGVSVKPENWDEKKQVIRGASKSVKDDNLILTSIKGRINNIYIKFRLEDRTLDEKTLIRELKNYCDYMNFWDFMEKQMEKRRDTMAKNTYAAHRSTLKKLVEILPALSFHEVHEETIKHIKKTMAKKYGNNPNTVSKNLVTLKTYVLIAIRMKLIERNPFEIEKIKKFKPQQVWLVEKELNKFVWAYQKDMFPANLHRVLEYFLFSCFTGMRLSDIKNFHYEQVKGDFIIINPVKTRNTNNEMITIPLTRPAKIILKNVAPNRVKGRVFECYSDQVTNRMLKKIADFVNVNKDISFHSARHTFATTFLERTDDLASLQKLLVYIPVEN